MPEESHFGESGAIGVRISSTTSITEGFHERMKISLLAFASDGIFAERGRCLWQIGSPFVKDRLGVTTDSSCDIRLKHNICKLLTKQGTTDGGV